MESWRWWGNFGITRSIELPYKRSMQIMLNLTEGCMGVGQILPSCLHFEGHISRFSASGYVKKNSGSTITIIELMKGGGVVTSHLHLEGHISSLWVA